MSLPLSHIPAPAVSPGNDSAPPAAGAATPSAEPLLALALERAQVWAPPGALRAVLLAGSLAAGEGVWARTADGPRLLSDVDLYLILRDEAAAARARARARGEMPGLLARARALGLWAPIDLGWLGEEELDRMPARPGTLELARARVLWGDAAVLARIPRHTARDVSGEEVFLLLENRAADLLIARAWLERGGAPGVWRALHTAMKVALDLAGVLALLEGRYPEQAAERVSVAEAALRSGGALAACAPRLPELWARALGWRRAPTLAEAPAIWREVVTAWTCVWLESGGRLCAERGSDPYARLVQRAQRARWRRRVRRSFGAPGRGIGPEPLGFMARLGRATLGTPQHRVNACAGALLFSASESVTERATLGPRAARTLRRLAPFRAPSQGDWEWWGRAVIGAWDAWFQDGQRAAEAP